MLAARPETAEEIALLLGERTGEPHLEELHERIFEEFFQVPGSRALDGKGTGLGLPYARRLVGILGGALRVASTPGSGSTFTVCLPAGAS